MNIGTFKDFLERPQLRPFVWPAWVGFKVALLVAFLSFFMPNQYKSEGRVLPSEGASGGSLEQYAEAAAMIGANLPGAEEKFANTLDVLESYWLRENLLNTEFTFKARSWRFGADVEQHERLIDFLHAKNIDQGLKALMGILSASKDVKTKLLTISAETGSPELSQLIVEKSIDLLEQFILEKQQTKGGKTAAFTLQRLQDAEKEYDQAESEFGRFLENNQSYITCLDPHVRLKGMRLEGNLQLRRQLAMTLAVNHEHALLEEKNDVPIINVLDHGNLPVEKSRPVRSKFVILSFLITAIAAWGWANRSRFAGK